MPQELQQWQTFCNRCQRPTLHQRILTYPNHILHLLLFLFCCGMWLPIWILIAVVSSLERAPPFLCTQCGQTAGTATPEQMSAWDIEASRQKIEKRAIQNAQRAEFFAKAQEIDGSFERRKAVFASIGSVFSQLPQLSANAVTLAITQLKTLPRRTDAVLKVIIGEDNAILLWFWRILIVVAVSALFTMTVYTITSMAIRLFS